MGLSMAERKAVTKAMARRYQRASKKQKGTVLDELCALTGWTRRHARRALAQAVVGRPERPRRPRPRIYGEEVLEALRFVWAVFGAPAGKRLAPFLPEAVEALERHELLPDLRGEMELPNDNCFAEQKNWPVVRQQVGYLRYETPAELEALRALYGHLRVYINFLQPQMHLVSKTRQGAKVTKRYDVARTPYRRVLDSPEVAPEVKEALRETLLGLNPAQLKRDIIRCQDRLIELTKATSESERR